MRHTFATDMLEIGADGLVIQEALGHTDIKTTKIYAHVKNPHLKKKLNLHAERLNSSKNSKSN